VSEPSVKSVMTREVESVSANSKLPDVLSCMAARNISCTIVVERRKPVGMLTERDIVKLIAQGLQVTNDVTVREVMHTPVYSVGTDLPLSEAGKLMQANGFRRFPVVDSNGKLIGIVTQTDILRGTVKTIESNSRKLETMVEARIQALAQKNRELEILSITDSLTGLANRRHLYQRFEEEMARARRYGVVITCTMLDIDYFKSVNDSRGHGFGDEVLKMIAHIIQESVRREDLAARYGGEEFVIVSASNQEGAKALADRICEFVSSCRLPTKDDTVSVSMSAGVAEYDPKVGPDDVDEMIRRADMALYCAKRSGRNCVVCYTLDMRLATAA